MKYKRLTKEELMELQPEFVNFLASAQITAQDWEKMKQKDSFKAEELIDVFSDMVYENVLGKINYLEYRDNKSLNIYFCSADVIILVGLRVKENSNLDLTRDDVFKQWNEEAMNAVNIIKSEKKYLKGRGEEVFELLQNGCFITDDRLFNTINNLI